MTTTKRTILLSNDDGFTAPGIRYLYDVLVRSYSCVVVAPDGEQSGIGHAFTFNKPLHYEKAVSGGMPGYIVGGTPADCVKFAISYLLPQRPDVIVSGLNLGENSGLSAFYSGTVAAAREGAFWNIPSFAFSVCKESAMYAKEYSLMVPGIMTKILDSPQKIPAQVFYNVNFPPCQPKDVCGTKSPGRAWRFLTTGTSVLKLRATTTKRAFRYMERKKTSRIWNTYDSRALMNNFITVSPLAYDATAQDAIQKLKWLEEQ